MMAALTTARKPPRPTAGILPQVPAAVGFTRLLGGVFRGFRANAPRRLFSGRPELAESRR